MSTRLEAQASVSGWLPRPFADFQSKLQDKAKATQVLANVNNIIAFRTLDPETQKYFCEPIPKTRLKYVMRTQGQNTDSKEPIVHGANFG